MAKKSKPTVVLGFLGTRLDGPTGARRWDVWRPTVSLCRQDDLVVTRLELLVDPRYAKLARTVVADVRTVSPETEVRVTELAFADAWDFAEVYAKTDGFARSYSFRPEEEDYLVHVTTGTHVAQICLFLLVETRRMPARLIQTSPPRGADSSSPGEYTIIDLDLSKYDELKTRFARERADDLSFLKNGIPTRNAAFNRLIEEIERVAVHSTAPLLLTGPTGAGKSQLARRIYDLKRQRGQLAGPAVEVNCATLRGDGAMSALFGHKKGAFTGALGDRAGLLRSADGGLLFLDEIGELGLDEQAMLLGAIEEKRFLPVGADKPERSEFQLIAGTNRDLRDAVRRGTFREDLLARIDLWTFRLPALRERPEDIEPNLDFELERWEGQHGRRVVFVSAARRRFLEYAVSPQALWPGNFRDFNAALVRMATLAPAGRIDASVVEEEIDRLNRATRSVGTRPDEAELRSLLGTERFDDLDRFDRVQLADVVAVCRASRSLSAAGRTLFAASRAEKTSTNDADRLRKYLARHGLEWRDLSAS